MLRPSIPDDLASDVDELVESQYGVDPDALAFADKLRMVLPDPQPDMNQQTAEGEGEAAEVPPVLEQSDPFEGVTGSGSDTGRTNPHLRTGRQERRHH